MIDFGSIDTSSLDKIALLIGIAFFSVLAIAILVVKLLQLIKLPKKIIQTLVSLVAIFGFLYLVAFLGDSFF